MPGVTRSTNAFGPKLDSPESGFLQLSAPLAGPDSEGSRGASAPQSRHRTSTQPGQIGWHTHHQRTARNLPDACGPRCDPDHRHTPSCEHSTVGGTTENRPASSLGLRQRCQCNRCGPTAGPSSEARSARAGTARYPVGCTFLGSARRDDSKKIHRDLAEMPHGRALALGTRRSGRVKKRCFTDRPRSRPQTELPRADRRAARRSLVLVGARSGSPSERRPTSASRRRDPWGERARC